MNKPIEIKIKLYHDANDEKAEDIVRSIDKMYDSVDEIEIVDNSTDALIQNKPKIVQILIGPEDLKWQGMMFGLGDDGIIYTLDNNNKWVGSIKSL